MVEQSIQMDNVFTALGDSTRRSILARVSKGELSVGEIAENYQLTFAAISKHLKVLEKANLISKKRRGKQQIVSASPKTIEAAEQYLAQYQTMMVDRFDRLDDYLKKGE